MVCNKLNACSSNEMLLFTVECKNLNVQNRENAENRTFSCSDTSTFGFQTLSEIRTVWQMNHFKKCRNPNVGISDIYCIYDISDKLRFQTFTVHTYIVSISKH